VGNSVSEADASTANIAAVMAVINNNFFILYLLKRKVSNAFKIS
jgi:hypothetical protein